MAVYIFANHLSGVGQSGVPFPTVSPGQGPCHQFINAAIAVYTKLHYIKLNKLSCPVSHAHSP